VFSACPTCGSVVLICAEVGTVFEIRERHAGSLLGDSVAAEDVCSKCGRSMYSDFRSATPDEILAVGFQPEDYR
jgi:DNA-directed RNA polymerase subunit RPC12/RpoP